MAFNARALKINLLLKNTGQSESAVSEPESLLVVPLDDDMLYLKIRKLWA